jgi:enoyl-CoA hydratase/carnithine racemase
MAYIEILHEIRAGVALITLNRPASLNAWTRVMEAEVKDALTNAAADDGVRVIVITGAGRGFCAGADMKMIKGIADQRGVQAGAADNAATATPSGLDAQYQQRFSYMLGIGKPIIAAINGPVAGIGLCFSLFCDYRLMADGAKLTTAFARRGLIAEHGISWMLPRLIGPMHALDLLLSSRTVAASEAAQIGLVKLLPAEGFMEAVYGIAAELANNSSPRSMNVIKRQVYDAMFQSLSEAWQSADEEMVKSFSSDDFVEGVAHFVEKRPPRFTGR